MVLNHCHDIRASGHLGVTKTLNRIRQRSYWSGIKNGVRSYIAACEKCAKRENPLVTKKALMQMVRSGYPMERIVTDIIGELPITENGNRYILVISDYFTKSTESFPMPNMEARTVAKIVVEEIVAKFEVPITIHLDQGGQFKGHQFQEMCKLLQIEKTRTTPYHQQSDGNVERFNRKLATMLSDFVDEHQRN